MAQGCGDKIEIVEESGGGAFFRRLGFLVVTGMALTLLAALVLLPAWAEKEKTRYELERDTLRLQEAKETVQALSRMMRDVQNDEILTQRLAGTRLGLYTPDEIIVRDPARPVDNPEILSEIHYPQPSHKDSFWLQTAAKLEKQGKRRSYMLLSAAMLISAFILFAPPTQKHGWRPWKLPPPPITKKD
ncbi:MAG TPA: hypothetical protein PKK48_06230 [Phycisphaerae bacterium]|nr:hypothetical protein [Phycisphaerae bacterium]HPS53011.1 hypothetical protein [Phycisphaerae bacterium]